MLTETFADLTEFIGRADHILPLGRLFPDLSIRPAGGAVARLPV